MGTLAWRARGSADPRRGRSVGHAHGATGGQHRGTVVRHALALSASIGRLTIAVVEASLRASLVPSVGASMRDPIAACAAHVVAIDLPPIVLATEMKDAVAPSAALGSKTLLLQRPPAPEREALPRTWPPSAR